MTAVNQFGSTKLYPFFLEELGFAGTFWLYAVVMLVLMVYGAASIPENRGQSLVKTEDKMVAAANKAFESETKL